MHTKLSPALFSSMLSTTLFFNFFIGFICLFTSEARAQSPHSVVFTGSSTDFNAAELFTASSGSVNYYMTYDASNIYIGAFASAGSFNSADNLTIYLDTDPQLGLTSGTGTTAGQL